jgi:broad specificity phosphatase PhoE
MTRTFVLTSARDREGAARAVAAAPTLPDMCVTSPSREARETAAYAVGGRWVLTVDEPLLVARTPGESGADVLARLAQAFRVVHATDTTVALMVCDGLDVLGATSFVLDDAALLRLADDLDRAVSLP